MKPDDAEEIVLRPPSWICPKGGSSQRRSRWRRRLMNILHLCSGRCSVCKDQWLLVLLHLTNSSRKCFSLLVRKGNRAFSNGSWRLGSSFGHQQTCQRVPTLCWLRPAIPYCFCCWCKRRSGAWTLASLRTWRTGCQWRWYIRVCPHKWNGIRRIVQWVALLITMLLC